MCDFISVWLDENALEREEELGELEGPAEPGRVDPVRGKTGRAAGQRRH